jgi:endo-1,4-beta-xylanase
MLVGTDGTTGYVETSIDNTAAPSAANAAEKVNTYTVTFPEPGNYELFARYYIGPGGANDDSWYYGQGFGNNTGWTLVNSGNIGFNQPGQTVYPGGTVGSNQWRWAKLTGAAGALPAVWTVEPGQLTVTFYWATRENGMRMDKFAFGRQGSWYTVNDLDTGGNATGTQPPSPPPVPPAYTRTGAPLATGYEPKFLGGAHSPGNALNFGAYWNQVTPENGGKWGSVEGTRDVMNWTQARAAREHARANGQVFKWHVLFWGNQQPNWMYSLTNEEQMEEIHEWLGAIAAEFPDLEQIEVVNEPLHDPPDRTSPGNTVPTSGSGGYAEALGGAGVTGWDWIINAFTLARQYFPNAKLMLNDYSITNGDLSTTRYLEIIRLLQDRGLIDLVGIQAHAFEFNYNNLPQSAATHTANIARLAETGLPIYATELDIDGVDPVFGIQDDALQLARYQAIFPVFWENDAIKGITMWGHVQGGHWRTAQGAWLMYPNGAERPALSWLVRYMENDLAVVTPGQAFSVDENVAEGTVVGTVAATDNDSGTTLSQWQMTDASGKFVLDAATGAISLGVGQSLDFEAGVSYAVSVSVYDGYRRSATETVTINVTNLNDNAPVITAGQSYRIDGGSDNNVAKVGATDADDTNQPGFTTLSNWAITSGNTNNVFRINSSGTLQVARPLLIDWRRSSYSLGSRVSDGANTSAVQAVQVTIPNRVKLCLLDAIRLEAPKSAAPVLILLGSELGSCRR